MTSDVKELARRKAMVVVGTIIFNEAIEAAAKRIEDRIAVLTESQRQWHANDPASQEIARIENAIEELALAASSIRDLKLPEGK